jgi:S1-C subfamily serine protease
MSDYGQPHFLPPHEHPRRSLMPLLFLSVCVAALAIAAIRYGDRALSADVPVEPRTITARGDLAADEMSTIELFERCSKSVVYISPLVRQVHRTLFGYRDTVVEAGTGSGFVWDAEGHIVTNFHVIQGADGCRVTLPDGSTHDAGLVGVWPDKDLAVLHIDANAGGLAPIAIGRSSDLKVGQKIFAIGNPFGLDFTLTTGVVSALNREIQAVNGRTIQGVIQTDAAINPGNSGGPLLDSTGRLIGINTSIYSRTGSSAGISFAVPVDTINNVVPQLIAHGKVLRPGLGVNVASDAVSQRLRLNGLLILNVTEGSGAQLAGLRPTTEARNGRIILGDIIVRVGGTATPTQDALLNALERYEVGETVEVTVNRQGEELTVPVTLQAVN